MYADSRRTTCITSFKSIITIHGKFPKQRMSHALTPSTSAVKICETFNDGFTSKPIHPTFQVSMETLVQCPESDPSPITIREVVAALKKEKLEPRHDSQNWGDWIYLEGSQTVISIESMRGLTSTATIEHAEDEPNDPGPSILKAFHKLGWVGMDEDGEYPLG